MKKNILIVVEEGLLSSALVRLLITIKEMEITTVSVFNRPGALAALRNEPKRFDLVLTELDEEDTFEFFAGMIRQASPRSKILLYGEDSRAKTQSAFVDAFVLKPEEESAALLRRTVVRLLTS